MMQTDPTSPIGRLATACAILRLCEPPLIRDAIDGIVDHNLLERDRERERADAAHLMQVRDHIIDLMGEIDIEP